MHPFLKFFSMIVSTVLVVLTYKHPNITKKYNSVGCQEAKVNEFISNSGLNLAKDILVTQLQKLFVNAAVSAYFQYFYNCRNGWLTFLGALGRRSSQTWWWQHNPLIYQQVKVNLTPYPSGYPFSSQKLKQGYFYIYCSHYKCTFSFKWKPFQRHLHIPRSCQYLTTFL